MRRKYLRGLKKKKKPRKHTYPPDTLSAGNLTLQEKYHHTRLPSPERTSPAYPLPARPFCLRCAPPAAPSACAPLLPAPLLPALPLLPARPFCLRLCLRLKVRRCIVATSPTGQAQPWPAFTAWSLSRTDNILPSKTLINNAQSPHSFSSGAGSSPETRHSNKQHYSASVIHRTACAPGEPRLSPYTSPRMRSFFSVKDTVQCPHCRPRPHG